MLGFLVANSHQHQEAIAVKERFARGSIGLGIKLQRGPTSALFP